jgi:hypothetical protein
MTARTRAKRRTSNVQHPTSNIEVREKPIKDGDEIERFMRGQVSRRGYRTGGMMPLHQTTAPIIRDDRGGLAFLRLCRVWLLSLQLKEQISGWR